MAAKKVKTAASAGDSYDAAALLSIDGLNAVRARPGMYIGSTGAQGLTHCVFEIFDNSVDEALAGHAATVTIVAYPDGSAEVRDDGRGIPVDVQERSGLPGVIFVLTVLHAGGKFGSSGYKVSGGLHGVGASVVNALSSRMDVEVDRGGSTWGVGFATGEPGQYDKAGTFTPSKSLRKLGRVPKSQTGTRLRFWPDMTVFQRDASIEWDRVIERARQTAFLVPGLTVVVEDRRGDELVEYRFNASGGLADLVAAMSPDDPIGAATVLRGGSSYTQMAQVAGDDGKTTAAEVTRDCEVEIALQWGNGFDYTLRSFTNVVETPDGGTHVTGFERALVKAILAKVADVKAMGSKEDPPTKDDVLEGITAVVAVRLPEPEFEGQTKGKLGTPQVAGIVGKVVADELNAWLNAPKNKAAVKMLAGKVADAARARKAAKSQREIVRRKSALESASMPDKLKDCRTRDIERAELFLVEGDSAGGTLAKARYNDFQAYLPLRGKILNVQRANEAAMLDNAECAGIVTTLGAGSGRSFDLSKIRYGKIVMLVDADIDGSHIRTLLLTMFYRYMRPLVEAGRVYAGMPPLFRLMLSGSGEVWAYTEADLLAKTARIEAAGRSIKHVQRMKGLGEMSWEQLRLTATDPGSRKVRRITIADAHAASELFGTLMGTDVPERRSWIVEHSGGFDRARLDV